MTDVRIHLTQKAVLALRESEKQQIEDIVQTLDTFSSTSNKKRTHDKNNFYEGYQKGVSAVLSIMKDFRASPLYDDKILEKAMTEYLEHIKE